MSSELNKGSRAGVVLGIIIGLGLGATSSLDENLGKTYPAAPAALTVLCGLIGGILGGAIGHFVQEWRYPRTIATSPSSEVALTTMVEPTPKQSAQLHRVAAALSNTPRQRHTPRHSSAAGIASP
jgi:hypothetical protein